MRLSYWMVLLVILTRCASPPISTPVIQPDAAVAVPEPEPLTLNPVQWKVMSLAELQKLVTQLQASHQNQVYFLTDADNYNNLSLNIIEIERYIKEQKAVLTMLKQIIAARSAASLPLGASGHP